MNIRKSVEGLIVMDGQEELKNHEEWNESYYFNFYDRKNQVTAFMRIGNKVNKNEKSMFFFLMTPQQTAGIKLETPCDDKPLSIAGLEYQELGPGNGISNSMVLSLIHWKRSPPSSRLRWM